MLVIQRSLKIPDKNYPSIRVACKGLEKKDLIRSRKGQSEKKVEIGFWSLTDKGTNCILANDSFETLELDRLIDILFPSEQLGDMKEIHATFGTDLTLKILKAQAMVNELHGNKPQSFDFLRAILYQGLGNTVLTEAETLKVQKFIKEKAKKILDSNPKLKKKLARATRRSMKEMQRVSRQLGLD
jgi:mannose-6-phosphate isomerase class I